MVRLISKAEQGLFARYFLANTQALRYTCYTKRVSILKGKNKRVRNLQFADLVNTASVVAVVVAAVLLSGTARIELASTPWLAGNVETASNARTAANVVTFMSLTHCTD